MIRKRTVFILGAGASQPFGFSTGKSQLDNARVISPEQLAAAIAPITRTRATELYVALRGTGEPSIDAMLSADSALLEAAKAYIARDIFNAERGHRTPRIEPPTWWYRRLWSNLPRRSLDELRQAPVRIFTFNYDRSLDDFLWRAIKQLPGASDRDVANVLSAIGPFHLHGQLGRLNGAIPGASEVIPYGGSHEEYGPTDADIVAAVREIKLISETWSNDRIFAQARHALGEAERVVFLGFAFYPDNLEKFDIPSSLLPTAELFASAYQITQQTMGHLKQRSGLANLQHGQEHWEVWEFLARFPQILD